MTLQPTINAMMLVMMVPPLLKLNNEISRTTWTTTWAWKTQEIKHQNRIKERRERRREGNRESY